MLAPRVVDWDVIVALSHDRSGADSDMCITGWSQGINIQS